MLNAYALHRILLDENGKPYDYEFIDVNPSFEKFTGISKEEIIGKRYKEIIKGIEEETNWIDVYWLIVSSSSMKLYPSVCIYGNILFLICCHCYLVYIFNIWRYFLAKTLCTAQDKGIISIKAHHMVSFILESRDYDYSKILNLR